MIKKMCKILLIVTCCFAFSGCKQKNTNDQAEIYTDASFITFGELISYSGNGIEVNGNIVTITSGGSYVISGNSDDGQIYVNTGDEEVELILDNLTLTCKNSSPIFIEKAGKATITLLEETVNTLKDTSDYSLNSDGEPTATIFSKEDLYFQGTGKLVVEANYNDGITSKDQLFIESGEYEITANDDGIVGKDLLTISSGTFTIQANGNGLKTSNETDTSLGNMNIKEGIFNIISNGDGIQTVNTLTIDNGTFNIKTNENSEGSSNKGLKAGQNIVINNGVFSIDSIDDSIHSNQNITINKGSYTIKSQDDAFHADERLTIYQGTIQIDDSYEGLEANEIEINGGTMNIISSDDGINAAGGNDQSGQMGPFEQNAAFGAAGNSKITINDGNIIIDARGDGIDANGSIYINGGTIYVNGPTSNKDGALDYDGECQINGGTLLAVGSGQMASNVSSSSGQASFMLNLNTTYDANTSIKIEDSNGNNIIEYTALKSIQSMVVSSPKLTVGETYTVYLNGSSYTNITLNSIVNGNSEMPKNAMPNERTDDSGRKQNF